MTEVVLFHHALGLTAGVVSLADRLRAAGHVVHTPDLFEGRRFATIEEGVAHAESIGMDTVIERGAAAVRDLGSGLVLAGISIGVLPAQKLAQTRAGVAAAVLISACVPAEFFGPWPPGVPVQVHAMDGDRMFADDGDLDAAREIVASADDAELFLYAGDQHYFVDDSLPSFDAAATDLLLTRMQQLVGRA